MNFPAIPNYHAVAVLLLTCAALGLFSSKRISLETSSLLIVVILAVGFTLFPFQVQGETLDPIIFFSGFANEALIAVCALMIAGQAILRTGGLEPVGRFLARLWKSSPQLSLLLTLVAAASISAFINNVPVVVLLLPVLISVAIKTGSSASAMLMPMGFATLLGGTGTTIGTSTNLLVVSVAAEMGLSRIGMFDFIVPSLLAGGLGIVYLWLLAPRLIPRREISIADTSARLFSTHLELLENSPVVDRPLSQALELTNNRMKVSALERGQGNMILPLPDVQLKVGDHLVIQDTAERLKEFERVLKGTLYTVNAEERPVDEKNPLHADEQQIAEVMVIQGSPLKGWTLNNSRFIECYGLITLAIHRADNHLRRIRDKLGDLKLAVGDILLVQGPREQIAELKKSPDVLVLDATVDLPFTRKAPLAMFIMKGIVLSAAFGLLPIAVSASVGALLMIVTGCLSWREATRALSTQVVLIVVASLALGTAMLKTGAAAYLASVFVYLSGSSPPAVIISGLMLLMALMTNVLSNNAAAVIGTPIAISIANQLHLTPEPFVYAVLFGANMSYATPMAYKTNLLIMNAGEYAFTDFAKVGIPLILLIWLVYSVFLPLVYL